MNKVLSNVANASGRMNRWLGAASAGVALIMVGAVVYGVVARYVFRSPTPWSIEFPQMLFMAMIAFCLGYAQMHREHVSVDLIISRFPGGVRKVFGIVVGVLTVGYCALVTWGMWGRLMVQLGRGEVTYESRIPLSPFSLAIVIGVAMLGLQVIVDTVLLARGAKPEGKPAAREG